MNCTPKISLGLLPLICAKLFCIRNIWRSEYRRWVVEATMISYVNFFSTALTTDSPLVGHCRNSRYCANVVKFFIAKKNCVTLQLLRPNVSIDRQAFSMRCVFAIRQKKDRPMMVRPLLQQVFLEKPKIVFN